MALKRRPVEVAASLAGEPGLVFFDSASGGGLSVIAARPQALLTGHINRDWSQVAEALKKGREAQAPGGLFGWVGFDGQFVFGHYPEVLVFDHATDEWAATGDLLSHARPVRRQTLPRLDFKPLVPREVYLRAVQRARDYIAAGDIYQVNLSYPWEAAWPAGADPFAFYRRLRRTSPAPYAAYLDLAGTRVMSSSPECFLRLSGQRIQTRPIKGTRPRFPRQPARDRASAEELAASAKENAELLMITDLERNDLGQVCEFGSVRVTQLAALEQFAQVFHLVSTVEGVLRPEVDHAAAFRACFPGGSISGAPKKRALEIIAELEPLPRGLYTGALGWFGFNQESHFNIAIRTAVQTGDTLRFHVGAGIVADSVPELEHDETLHKAAGLLAAGAG